MNKKFPEAGDQIKCIRCKEKFTAGFICFARACDTCYNLFETQKMIGRFAHAFNWQELKKTEFFDVWHKKHPFVSKDEDKKLQEKYGMPWSDCLKFFRGLSKSS